MGKKGQCMVPGCVRAVKLRGICNPCYQAAFALVKKKEATWDQLVEMGLVAHSPAKDSSNALVVAFEKAKAAQEDGKRK